MEAKNKNAMQSWGVLAVSTVFTLLLGWLDHITGNAIDLSVLYLVPVAAAFWMADRKKALIASVIAVIVWEYEQIIGVSSADYAALTFANAFLRLAFFVAAVIFMSYFKLELDEEKRLARTDILTGAMNRRAFFEKTEAALRDAKKKRGALTVAYIDIDSFKKLNDTLGHRHGDAVLISAAKTVSEILGGAGFLARIGGDEFAIVMPEIQSKDAKALLRLVKKELTAAGGVLKGVTYSIGAITAASCYPASAEALINKADLLMYRVKKKGKNNIRFSTI